MKWQSLCRIGEEHLNIQSLLFMKEYCLKTPWNELPIIFWMHLLQIMMYAHARVCATRTYTLPDKREHIYRGRWFGQTCKRQYDATQFCAHWSVFVWCSRPPQRTSKRTSLVWPDLFTLQAHLQVSSIHQNTHSLRIRAAQSYITSLCNCPPSFSLLFL